MRGCQQSLTTVRTGFCEREVRAGSALLTLALVWPPAPLLDGDTGGLAAPLGVGSAERALPASCGLGPS